LYKYVMPDETASKMYESARDRLLELLRQETEVKEQISHWAPIVEQLARLAGETVDAYIASRINELKQAEADGDGAAGGGAGDGADGGDPVGFSAAVVAAADADPGKRPHGGDGV
jgi:hypothetical protein